MKNVANLGPDPNQNRARAATNSNAVACDHADGTFQAGLFYIACDLRELAKTAPPVKAKEVLALCRLVEAMATA